MKKILTVMAMFLMLTGKANAGIEEYKYIAEELKNGKLKIFIETEDSFQNSNFLSKESETNIIKYIRQGANDYIYIDKYNESKASDQIFPPSKGIYPYSVLSYKIRITATKMPFFHPQTKKQLIAVNVIFSSLHSHATTIPYIDKSILNKSQELYLSIIETCRIVREQGITTETIPFYGNEAKILGKSIVKHVLRLSDNTYKWRKEHKKSY